VRNRQKGCNFNEFVVRGSYSDSCEGQSSCHDFLCRPAGGGGGSRGRFPEPKPQLPFFSTTPFLLLCAGRLEAAVARVADFLNRATKPVLVAGAHMRSARARAAMVALAEASGGSPTGA